MSEERQGVVRVVVVGGNQSGKTSLVNAILDQKQGEPTRRTASILKREGRFEGRQLICIDTPGWWRNYQLNDTAEFMKQKLKLSATMCTPGPHAFLLTINIDTPFTEKHRRSVEEHLGLFEEKIWKHVIVVFTRRDCLRGKSIEQHIAIEGEPLQWVLDKCYNRYHIVKSGSSRDVTEITELLQKVDSIKAHLGYFLFDMNSQKAIDERCKQLSEKAQSRREKVKALRETLGKHAQLLSLSEVRILLLGWVCSGKSSAKNIILDVKGIVGGKRTDQLERDSAEVAGKHVTVVDTPGWWKYFPAQYTPEWVKTMLKESVTLDGKNPHAILLTIPVDTSFGEEQRKITEDNMRMLFGEQVWRHTIVLFTSGDLLGETAVEEHIEGEGAPLQWLIEKCGNRYHVFNREESDEGSQVKELLKKVHEMASGNSLFGLHEETKAQNAEEQTVDATDKSLCNMVKFLDHKWKRLDKDMEETIINICKDFFQPKHTRSLPPTRPQFAEDKPHIRRRCSSSPSKPQAVSGAEGPATPSKQDKEDEDQTSFRNITEILEREWGRRDATLMERFQRVLSDLMEKDCSSDSGVADLEHVTRKVIWWFEHGPYWNDTMADHEEV